MHQPLALFPVPWRRRPFRSTPMVLIAGLLVGLLTWGGLGLLLSPPAPAATAKATAKAAPQDCATEPSWVTLDGKPVLELRRAVGARDVKELMRQGNTLLRQVAEDPAIRPQQFVVVEDPPYSLVGLESSSNGSLERLLAVDDRMAACFDLTRQQLANRYRDKLRSAVMAYRSSHSLSSWLQGTALALLVLGIYVLWLRGQSALHRRLRAAIQGRDPSQLSGVTLGGNTLLDAAQITRLLQTTLQVCHWSVLLLISYLLIPLLLGFFPPTTVIAAGLRAQILGVVSGAFGGLVNAIPNLLTILVILAITVAVIRFSRMCFAALAQGRIRFAWFYPEWAEPTSRIASVLILAAGLVISFPYVPGSGSKVFQGAGLFVGVLAALGSSSVATNVISGLMLIYTRAFTEGDRVMIEGVVGVVQERALLVTRLRTPRNELVSIPNASVIGASVINYSFARREIREPVALSTTITIGYDVPWRQVHELMLAAARSVPSITEEREPFVLQTSLNDFHISYELTAYVKDVSQYREALSAVLAALQDQFAAADVEILSPGYHAIRNGNRSTVPPPPA
ncbi:MAG: mechanosensitive ion channel domain-containing protein [Synechococcus sp.]|nr:mechanosensitive ion channel domain-containing protein [Synechococcus sp.]